MAAKTDEEFAAQEAANKKKAEEAYEKANEEALASRREILKSFGLEEDADGTPHPKAVDAEAAAVLPESGAKAPANAGTPPLSTAHTLTQPKV